MSIWHDRPAMTDAVKQFDLIRTPTKGALNAIILSKELIGTKLHFWRKRSVPCTYSGCKHCNAGEKQPCPAEEDCTLSECEPCKQGQVPRWKGYVYMLGLRHKQIAIFEFTSRAFTPMDAYFTEHGTLRGGRFTAERPSGKPNGALRVTFDSANYDSKDLPTPIRLRDVLMHIWECNNKAKTTERGSEYDMTTLDEEIRDQIEQAK